MRLMYDMRTGEKTLLRGLRFDHRSSQSDPARHNILNPYLEGDREAQARAHSHSKKGRLPFPISDPGSSVEEPLLRGSLRVRRLH